MKEEKKLYSVKDICNKYGIRNINSGKRVSFVYTRL